MSKKGLLHVHINAQRRNLDKDGGIKLMVAEMRFLRNMGFGRQIKKHQQNLKVNTLNSN
jgi:hypothetical protein